MAREAISRRPGFWLHLVNKQVRIPGEQNKIGRRVSFLRRRFGCSEDIGKQGDLMQRAVGKFVDILCSSVVPGNMFQAAPALLCATCYQAAYFGGHGRCLRITCLAGICGRW